METLDCAYSRTNVSTITVSIGNASATSAALRHVVIEPKKNIAHIPITVHMLVIVSKTPRTDGCLK